MIVEPKLLIFVIVFPIFFIAFWWFIVRTLGSLAGLSKDADLSPLGEFVESYGIGSVRIGLINYNNCMNVDRYQNGYLLGVWKIFGGGKRVILFNDIVSVTERSYFLFMRQLVMELTSGKRIRFYGKFARTIGEDQR